VPSQYGRLRKHTFELLIGALTEGEKKAAIAKVLDEERDVFIFLLSMRSCSEGLNLTKASITIIFDPDWNPQNDLQASSVSARHKKLM
jgi:SNF2 family DNA or RNA helicase